MDNLDKIKFKEAENGWFIKIFLDIDGNEISRTASFADGKGSGTGLFKEMQAWIEAGSTIEPKYTTAELKKKKADEKQTALNSQKQTAIRILDKINHKFLPNYRYQEDVPAWQAYQNHLFEVIASSTIVTIQDKPF